MTIYSLFPTCDGNFIFATAPVNVPYGEAPTAVVAHLSLIHDMSLLHEHSWCYTLSLSDAQGKRVYLKKFSPDEVGGLFNLNSTGSLKWNKDAKAITVTRRDDTKATRALHGLTRALLANMVVGVTEGFREL